MPPIRYVAEEWKTGKDVYGVVPLHELDTERMSELGSERTPELEGKRIGKGLNSLGMY